MKVQCARCKEVVALGGFRLLGDAIELTCPECGESYRVGSEKGEVMEDREAEIGEGQGQGQGQVPGMECPKCGVEQPEAEACRACGLKREKFAEYAAAEVEEPVQVAAAWSACRERWQEQEVHDQFLDAVAAAQAFGPAARHYREVLRERPADERARRGLARVTRMAEATLMGAASARRGAGAPAGPEPYKNVVLLLLAMVLLAGVFGIYALFRSKQEAEEQQTRQPPAGGKQRAAPGGSPMPRRTTD